VEKKISRPDRVVVETKTVRAAAAAKPRKPRKKRGKLARQVAPPRRISDSVEWHNSVVYLRSLNDPFSGGNVRIPSHTLVPTCTQTLRLRLNLTPQPATPAGAMVQLFMCPNATDGIWVKDATTTSGSANTWVATAWDGLAELTANAYCYRVVSMGANLSFGGQTETRGMSMYAGRTYGQLPTGGPPATLYNTAVQHSTVQLFNSASQDNTSMVWAPAFDSELVSHIATPNSGMACVTGTGWRAVSEVCCYDYNFWLIGEAPTTSTDIIFADLVLNVEYVPLSYSLTAAPMAITPGAPSVTEAVMAADAFSGGNLTAGLFEEVMTTGKDIATGFGKAASWAAKNVGMQVGKNNHSLMGGLAAMGIDAGKNQGGVLGAIASGAEQIHLPEIFDAVTFASSLLASKHCEEEVIQHRAAVLGGYPEQSPLIQRRLKTLNSQDRHRAKQGMEAWSKPMRPPVPLLYDVEPASPVGSVAGSDGYLQLARARPIGRG